MKYQFKNKVAVVTEKKRNIWKKIMIFCGVLSASISLILFVMEGPSGIEFATGIFLPVFLIWRGTDKDLDIQYVQVPTLLSIDDECLTVEYPEIKRAVDGEISRECYQYRKGDISQFQYSKELCALRIVGTPFYTQNSTESKSEDCRLSHSEKETVLYLPEDMIQAIIVEIEKQSGLSVSEMDDEI